MPKRRTLETGDEGRKVAPTAVTLGEFLDLKLRPQKLSDLPYESCSVSQCKEGSATECSHVRQENSGKVGESTEDWLISQTKSGGLPVKVENRSSGKKVTLISNVRGGGHVLLQDLKTKFGTGGVYKNGVVELQGDFKSAVVGYLAERRHLIKPYHRP